MNVDYELIERLESVVFGPIEHVVQKAERVAEYYYNHPELLTPQHPHILEFGWPPYLTPEKAAIIRAEFLKKEHEQRMDILRSLKMLLDNADV